MANENPPANRGVAKGMTRVRVGKQPLNEEGHRVPGEVFDVTEERAKALGKLVTPAPDAPLGLPKEEPTVPA